jgi:hypothetical protein
MEGVTAGHPGPHTHSKIKHLKDIIAMKTIAMLALATITLAAAPAASAADYSCSYRVNVGYCAPYYVRTKEVCRRNVCKYAYDHCGRRYSYNVVVITYADIYSDGSSRSYTRSFRG